MLWFFRSGWNLRPFQLGNPGDHDRSGIRNDSFEAHAGGDPSALLAKLEAAALRERCRRRPPARQAHVDEVDLLRGPGEATRTVGGPQRHQDRRAGAWPSRRQ